MSREAFYYATRVPAGTEIKKPNRTEKVADLDPSETENNEQQVTSVPIK